jgi:hypothetical protein
MSLQLDRALQSEPLKFFSTPLEHVNNPNRELPVKLKAKQKFLLGIVHTLISSCRAIGIVLPVQVFLSSYLIGYKNQY